jgi:hypothetical protein
MNAVVDEPGVAFILIFVIPNASREANAGLLAASSRPPASALNTDDTDLRPCSRAAAMSCGSVSGAPGT